jgi:molybdopterin-guanine dinucleotide biosynthesis protein A
VRDTVEGAGPLAGIAAGLAACTTPWLLVVAGDMPFLTGALLDRMIGSIDDSIDAVGIRIDALPEPLLCVLHVERVRDALMRRLAAGRFKASGLLTDEDLVVRWLDAGGDEAALRNVNSPEDLNG